MMINVAPAAILLAALCGALRPPKDQGRTALVGTPLRKVPAARTQNAANLTTFFNTKQGWQRQRHVQPDFHFQGISAGKLNELERHFAGNGVSSSTTNAALEVGGDRMNPTVHNYGPTYALYLTKLAPMLTSAPTIVEVGILKGTGLAMWASIFPSSAIYGFDIDTSVYLRNLPHLKQLGLNNQNIHVTLMDQHNDNKQLIAATLGNAKANIVADDGLHSFEGATKTFDSMLPSLAGKFVYFIEDGYGWHHGVREHVMQACPTCKAEVTPPLGPKGEHMIVVHRL